MAPNAVTCTVNLHAEVNEAQPQIQVFILIRPNTEQKVWLNCETKSRIKAVACGNLISPFPSPKYSADTLSQVLAAVMSNQVITKY